MLNMAKRAKGGSVCQLPPPAASGGLAFVNQTLKLRLKRQGYSQFHTSEHLDTHCVAVQHLQRELLGAGEER
jgi:hypothetical protein